MTQEIELKLVIDPADRDRLAATIGRAPDAILNFATTYFDTADGSLAAAGLSLRIRRRGRARTQTVKQSASVSAGLLSRGEWECAVTTDIPQLDGDDPASALLAGDTVGLEARFALKVRRQMWLVDAAGSTIELVLDQGVISAGKARAPLSEIEAELIEGDPAALFALAARIGRSIPLRVGLWTKAQQGERLLADARPVSLKAGKIALKPTLTPAEGLAFAIAAGISQARINEDVLLAGHHANAVHQLRIALRRLRATLAIFEPLIKTKARRALNDRLRQLGQALGPLRERDVLLAELALEDRPGAIAARDAAFADVRALLDGTAARHLPLDLLALAHQPKLLRKSAGRVPVGEVVQAGLHRLEQRLIAQAGVLVDQTPDARHLLRKRAKALRYGLDIAAGLIDDAGRKSARRRAADHLAAIQEALGTLNDVAERPALLARLGLPPLASPPVDETALLAEAQAALDALLRLLPIWPSIQPD